MQEYSYPGDIFDERMQDWFASADKPDHMHRGCALHLARSTRQRCC